MVRRAAALAALALLAGGCGGSTTPSAGSGTPSTTTAEATTAAPATAAATTAAPATAAATTAATTGVPPDRSASILPSVRMIDVTRGTTVDLASLIPARRPLLLWFWAPH